MRPPTTMTFSGKQAIEMISLCVYAWVRGTEWLYVGKSAHGIGRIAQHHAIRPTMIKAGDEILLWRLDTEYDALCLEAELIHANNPVCNRAPADKAFLAPSPLRKTAQPKSKPARLPPMTPQELKQSNQRIADSVISKNRVIGASRSHASTPKAFL